MFENKSKVTTQSFEGFDVQGSVEFREQVVQALQELREKAPEILNFVQANIGLICEAHRSGLDPHKKPPQFNLSLKSANYSPTWTASVIAHDAFHSSLFLEYRRSRGERVPDEEWAGVKAEKKALEYQGAVLERLAAPQWEKDYQSKLDGTHGNLGGSLNRFRDYWKFWKRDW